MGLSMRLHTGRGGISSQHSVSPPLYGISLRVSTLQLRERKRTSRKGLCACSSIGSPSAVSSCCCSHHVRLSTGRTESVFLRRGIWGHRTGARRDLSQHQRSRMFNLNVKSKNSGGCLQASQSYRQHLKLLQGNPWLIAKVGTIIYAARESLLSIFWKP